MGPMSPGSPIGRGNFEWGRGVPLFLSLNANAGVHVDRVQYRSSHLRRVRSSCRVFVEWQLVTTECRRRFTTCALAFVTCAAHRKCRMPPSAILQVLASALMLWIISRIAAGDRRTAALNVYFSRSLAFANKPRTKSRAIAIKARYLYAAFARLRRCNPV